jgi:hypothetical protein
MLQDFIVSSTSTSNEVTIYVGAKHMVFPGITAEQMSQGYEAYQQGKLVQEAFPFLSPDQREFLISGLTPEEWAEIFPT